ncbi:MAG TPA: dipicolinate synthase subunit B [Firmicutes bacterium]|uniref:Dipicolinate synthase subunit B n=1 Tax=Capillibacterium thermochitinicola TaxID=2699427 RepID=A0A8J6HY98_9FIRM|nr:dipicolinate synthase subunit B [Capillibacterium thermochitinicola]MBA2132090.1 dipicolinate synthase subunit B [Capillibacterium thermochitinicola]HHW13270.1 dipicolinate synthase subunit B [Bacillota bacterium]
MQLAGVRIGFGLTGSYCTIPDVIPVLKQLRTTGAELFPIASPYVLQTDTRFGKGEDLHKTLVEITGREPWQSLVEVEPIGPKRLLDIMVVAPCTGTTLSNLAHGVSNTPVTLACKAQLRNERPVVLAVSTNDGLGANLANLGMLLNRKFIYFVPFGQDDPERKPNSLVAKMELLLPTVVHALEGKQIQPLLQ